MTARRKKAFAQLEESEKAVESKRKALQQALEVLEEARHKHAAAQQACASLEQEIDEEEDEDEDCVQDADHNKGRDSYQDWYNPSAHFSHSAEILEMRTAVSQICATLALLVKALLPGILESGTQFQLQPQAPQAGVRVEETSSVGGPKERFALETPPRLTADSDKEKKSLAKEQENNQVVNSVEEAAKALQPFRSTLDRHQPY